MDAENDNEQPNSSSASASSGSSSNNSSSSNLLGHLPMLPFMRSTDDDEQDSADGEVDGNENDLIEEPMPLQPPVTVATAAAQAASVSMQQPTLAPISTTASSSVPRTEATATTPSVGREEPMEAASSGEIEEERHQNVIQLDGNDNNDFDVDLNLRNDGALDNASTSNHQQQQETPLNSSLGTFASSSSEPSSSGQQQQTLQPPTTLPLLLQHQQEQEQHLQQQDELEEEEQAEESKHLPSYDHHYHNPSEFHHTPPSHPYQNSCVFPCGYRSSELTRNSNGATNNNNMFGNTMSSDCQQHSSTGSVAAARNNHQVVDRLKLLYPNVNENETPLPRCWSAQEKCLSIGLSQNNLRVNFKGKQSNDAASVRTAHPIPPACGIYYFEVKIISKGKNGYMGIGLTAQQFRTNRLPGWDKQSYGYHGDDGNSFSSSGHGQSYGPTFTTGDIIGCCVNFVNNTCFYTKNGVDLGIAFRELPTKLYPTVGLQTPGEEVDANFGQEPFKFNQIEEMMKQMRGEIKATIYDFPLPADQGDPTALLQKMVNSYLVHNGYSQTAEAFAGQKTGLNQKEDISSIRNRQKILKLVMSGKMGQAIDQTMRLYPGLLENNKNLWFMLKCRQFIEMINGSDVEYCPSSFLSSTNTANKTTNSITTQTSTPNQTSVIQSTKLYQNGNVSNNSISNGSAATTTDATTSTTATEAATATTTAEATTTSSTNTNTTITTSSSNNTSNAATIAANTTTTTTINNAQNSSQTTVINTDNDLKTQTNLVERCSSSNDAPITLSKSSNDNDYLNDVEMENNGHTNGNVCKNGDANNFNDSVDADEEMDVDVLPSVRKYSHGIERILDFGKDLSQMGQQLEKENKMTDEERQMLEDAFSLIAYSNPWSSPLGWQLCPTKRETVCRALNSAILESMNYPKWSPLEYCIAHASELLKVMAQASIGACAFVNIADVYPNN